MEKEYQKPGKDANNPLQLNVPGVGAEIMQTTNWNYITLHIYTSCVEVTVNNCYIFLIDVFLRAGHL